MPPDIRATPAKEVDALDRDAAGDEDVPTHAAILTTSSGLVKL